MRSDRPTRRSRSSRLLCITALLLAAGCEKPIFIPDEPRSQFDRGDALYDRRAETFVTDEFGNRRPNLVGRLSGLR